jgi:UDP-3-O-[3-hydroxymyristoyl] glucosamine N-acyltransferase
LAIQFGCELRGDPAQRVSKIATLEGDSNALGFVVNPAFRDALRQCRLGAVVLDAKLAAECPVAALIHRNPHATFARIASQLYPRVSVTPGVHPLASVHADAHIDPTAQIGAFVVVEAGARIGARCSVEVHGFVGRDSTVGADTHLLPRVSLFAGVQLGERCIVHPGAVIGSDGFGNARDGEGWVKIPQVGSVRIGDDVEIGANTTIDRGALENTVIEDGARLDNQIQIGHNVVIGAHTAIAACVGIAGSTRIGKRCMIGGGTGIGGQLVLGDDIIIAGFGMVTHSLDKPGMYSSVLPVEEVRVWRRIVGRIKRLDTMVSRINKLEAQRGASAGQDNDD